MGALAKIYDVEETPPIGVTVVLSVQQVAVMAGSTVAAAALTGLDPSVALFCSGLATLAFHALTKGRVPAYLGSSFAFIAAIAAASRTYGAGSAAAGVSAAGAVYLVVGALMVAVDRMGLAAMLRRRHVGHRRLRRRVHGLAWLKGVLPPWVAGPLVIVLSLALAPVAIGEAQSGWESAFVAAAIVVGVSVFARGLARLSAVLFGIVGGTAVAALSGDVDFRAVATASWVAVPKFTLALGHLPTMNLAAIGLVAPIALAAMAGDIAALLAIGGAVERNVVRRPGLHRALFASGIATMLSGFVGGLPQTIYPENIGLLALTRVWSARVLQGAAMIAMAFSFCGKLTAALAAIPAAVIAGVSIALYGMVATVGVRMLVRSGVDFAHSGDMLIAAVILVVGMGGVVVRLGGVSFAGIAPAAVAGIALNLALPAGKDTGAAPKRKGDTKSERGKAVGPELVSEGGGI